MTPEIIRYKVPSSQADAFIQAYRAAGDALKASPHCHGFELLRSVKEPDLFLLTIRWDSSEGHLQGFRGSQEFRTFFGHIKPYVSNILEMEHYAATDVNWTR
ncbi:MAG TPA: antibiotic biosynthesis monooxygenase family protein [Steroidobacteraceae bacterium]|nr:antibiotic biosynthesis monooxygenase family protein [Steroidobacteraceae bacterium]